jgi:hypothetical protein
MQSMQNNKYVCRLESKNIRKVETKCRTIVRLDKNNDNPAGVNTQKTGRGASDFELTIF